jgi:hypothetical protein
MANDKEIPRPACLARMTEVARQLSADFDFVRVDLYEAGGRVMFGELTFSPAGGVMNYYDDEFNLFWGGSAHQRPLGDLLGACADEA